MNPVATSERTYPLDQDPPLEKPDARRYGVTGEKLSKFLLRISDNIEAADREKRLKLFRKQIKAHQYFDGNFFGYVDANCEWKDADLAEGEVSYTDNQLYPYFRTALMELARTQTAIQINPAVKSEEMEMVARFAQTRYNANRERTFSAQKKQTENSYALLNGITYRYTYFEFDKSDKNSRREKVPKIIRNQTEDKEMRFCANCSKAIPDNAALNDDDLLDTPCDSCGSKIIKLMKVPSDKPDITIGYAELKTGQNKWIAPNPVSVIVQMQADSIETTSYLKWKQLVLRSVLEQKYPNIELKSTGTESIELRYITNQKLSTPSGSDGGQDYDATEPEDGGSGKELEILEEQLIWLDYAVYCKWKDDENDTKLSNGEILPRGTTLGEKYPDGLFYAKVGQTIVDMWNEDKNRKWTATPYSLRAGSLYGHGASIALSDQELLNDQKKLQMANFWSNGVSREFVDPDKITELSSDPAIPTMVTNHDGNDIIGSAYAQAPPVQLSAEVYAMEETTKGSMQNKIGAMSNGSGGLADSEKWGETATAISIKRDLAVGRFAPDLELMADNLDRKQAYQFLRNEQTFFTPNQWKEVKGDYGDDALKGFLECDIEKDLLITVVPGSFMPVTEGQSQSRFMALAQVLPMIAQMGNPELISYAFETFGVPEKLGGWSADKSRASNVIERFQVIADWFLQSKGDAPNSDLANPQVLQVAEYINEYSKVPVDVFLDNHQALADAYTDWRTTDAGQSASNVLVAAVALRKVMHLGAITKQGQFMKNQAIEENAPLEEKAKEEQEQQLLLESAQSEKGAEEAKGQAQMAIMEKAVDAEEKETERQHELMKMDKQQAHEKEMSPPESSFKIGE